MAATAFKHRLDFIAGPALGAVAVTPSDTVDLEYFSRGVFVGVTGDLKVTMHDGQDVTFTNVVAGVVLPLAVARIWATGTTATGIVAVF